MNYNVLEIEYCGKLNYSNIVEVNLGFFIDAEEQTKTTDKPQQSWNHADDNAKLMMEGK